jgi:hypothetical protein
MRGTNENCAWLAGPGPYPPPCLRPWRYEQAPVTKTAWPGALPLPPPPVKITDGEVKRLTNMPHSFAEEKFQALRASRRAQGLCIRCGAKWSRDHKCSETVQLQLVQELLDMFPEIESADESGPSSPTASQIMLHRGSVFVAEPNGAVTTNAPRRYNCNLFKNYWICSLKLNLQMSLGRPHPRRPKLCFTSQWPLCLALKLPRRCVWQARFRAIHCPFLLIHLGGLLHYVRVEAYWGNFWNTIFLVEPYSALVER